MEMNDPLKEDDNEWIFGLLSIYVFLSFIFLIFQRLLLFKVEELKWWIKLAKVVVLLYILCFVFGINVYILVLQFGIPNLLFSINIVSNIASRKTVTENWSTALLKIALYFLSPIAFESNNTLNPEYTINKKIEFTFVNVNTLK